MVINRLLWEPLRCAWDRRKGKRDKSAAPWDEVNGFKVDIDSGYERLVDYIGGRWLDTASWGENCVCRNKRYITESRIECYRGEKSKWNIRGLPWRYSKSDEANI